jgi:excisionase family DNA binding protein
MKPQIAPRFIRAKDAAQHLGLTYSAFREMVLAGGFPYYRMGKQNRLFKIDELDQAMAAFRVAPTSEVLS